MEQSSCIEGTVQAQRYQREGVVTTATVGLECFTEMAVLTLGLKLGAGDSSHRSKDDPEGEQTATANPRGRATKTMIYLENVKGCGFV